MIFPTVPKIEGAIEVLEMLLTPKKTAEVLKSIMDAQAMVDQSIKRYERFKSVETAQKAADAQMAAANAERDKIKRYAEAQKTRADNLVLKAEQKQREVDIADAQAKEFISQSEASLDIRRKELEKREEKVAKDTAEVAQAKAYADKSLKEANEIKAEYESKLLKLREMAA